MGVAKRASVPLDDRDVAALARIADRHTPEGRRLRRLIGDVPHSEAKLITAVMRLGIERLQMDAAYEGYQWLALSYENVDEKRLQEATRAQVRRHHTDEEEEEEEEEPS